MYYCRVIPPKKMVEVESIVITIGDEEFVFDKDEAVELRDLLLDVFPKEESSPWAITTSSEDAITWPGWTGPNTTIYYPNTTTIYEIT